MEENIQLFIKFGAKENLEKLQKGFVHMGNRFIYSNFENENNEDKKDGIRNEDESTLFKIGNFKLIDDKNTLYKPMFCIFQLEAKKKNSGKIIIKFTDEQLKKLPTAFGDYALIINKDKFIKNFINNAQANHFTIKHGKVAYRHSDFLKTPIEKVLNSGFLESDKIIVGDIDRDFLDSSFFEQPIKHEYQNEYRFIFKNIDSKNYYSFEIDEIQNYSKLVKVTDLLDGTVMELTEIL